MYNDHRPSDLVSIRQPAGDVGDDGGQDIRRSTEKLTLLPRVPHPRQDNRLEVAVSVSGECRRQEIERPAIELPVLKMMQDLGCSQWILFCIATVMVDPIDHKLLLLRH